MDNDPNLCKMLTVDSNNGEGTVLLRSHKHIILAYFDTVPEPELWMKLNETEAQILLELMYGKLD